MSSFDEKWAATVTERLDTLEVRTAQLESLLLQTGKKKLVLSNSAEGLSGSIVKLIQEGFLNEPKTRREVQDELNRQGYYYRAPAVHTALTRDFMKRKNILTRIGKKREWRYVLKK